MPIPPLSVPMYIRCTLPLDWWQRVRRLLRKFGGRVAPLFVRAPKAYTGQRGGIMMSEEKLL